MEKRIGAVVVLVKGRRNIPKLNTIISNHADIIIARQGLPLIERDMSVISFIVEGSTDRIGSLTGRIGRLDGLQAKSVLTKYSDPKKGGYFDP
ncbi:MAG: hypothetical protein B6244_12570 [Candidatus Cloacimonetes bacterium 4572_55]|nr:MAG: hypothetical protein B6244_12570 [Candidatus Cloacimonetes bacterium 4572_55]